MDNAHLRYGWKKKFNEVVCEVDHIATFAKKIFPDSWSRGTENFRIHEPWEKNKSAKKKN